MKKIALLFLFIIITTNSVHSNSRYGEVVGAWAGGFIGFSSAVKPAMYCAIFSPLAAVGHCGPGPKPAKWLLRAQIAAPLLAAGACLTTGGYVGSRIGKLIGQYVDRISNDKTSN